MKDAHIRVKRAMWKGPEVHRLQLDRVHIMQVPYDRCMWLFTMSGAISPWLISVRSTYFSPHEDGVFSWCVCWSTKRTPLSKSSSGLAGPGPRTPAPHATIGVSVFAGSPSPWLPARRNRLIKRVEVHTAWLYGAMSSLSRSTTSCMAATSSQQWIAWKKRTDSA